MGVSFYYIVKQNLVINFPNLKCAFDINECTNDTDNCHQKAKCTNTDGSFECKCMAGYTGNGTKCEGKSCILTAHIHWLENGCLILLHSQTKFGYTFFLIWNVL